MSNTYFYYHDYKSSKLEYKNMEYHNGDYVDYNETYEPMDVDISKENVLDLSAQSVKDMDISYGDSAYGEVVQSKQSYSRSEADDISRGIKVHNTIPEIKTPVIKKYHIMKEKPIKYDQNIYSIILSTVIVLVLSSATYHIYNINCSDDLNIEMFRKALGHNVFGQSKAIATIIEALEMNERSKLLFFYGGTGVGKTLVSSLILNMVGMSSNVYHYTMPSFTDIFSTDVMVGLTLCQSSLLIVDDLTGGNMHIVDQIKAAIAKAENLQRNITVILIFNCHDSTKELFRECDESFYVKLLDNFSGIRAPKSFVKFEPLTEKELRRCIEQEIGSKKLNEMELAGMMAHFNVTADGCKGVHSKMKYLNVI